MTSWAQANTYLNIGQVQVYQQKYDDAEQSFLRTLDLHRENGSNDSCLAVAYVNLGKLQLRVGSLSTGQESLNCAVKLFHDIGNPSGEAETLQVLGELQMTQGNFQEAETLFTRASELYHDIEGFFPDLESANLVLASKAQHRHG